MPFRYPEEGPSSGRTGSKRVTGFAAMTAALVALTAVGGGCAAGQAQDSFRSPPSPPAPPSGTVDSGTPPAVSGGEQGGEPKPVARADGRRGVPASSRDSKDKRIYVTVDGERIYVRNGAQVWLEDGLTAEIYIDPYPPTTLRLWMDVYLTRDGVPVTDASIGIDYDMLAMAHGPYSGEAQKTGDGHYLFKLDYIMFGPYDQLLTIRLGLKWIELPIVIVAYP